MLSHARNSIRLHLSGHSLALALAASVGLPVLASGCTHPDEGGAAAMNAGNAGNTGGTGSAGESAGSSGQSGTGVSATASSGASAATTSGAAGANSGAGDAGAAMTVDAASLTRGPTPPSKTTQFPFPQNRQANNCTYPTAYNNADVQAAYTQWKNDLVISAGNHGEFRVQRTSSDGVDGCRPQGSTVSEGIAYGMLLAVYMDDETLFDGLWLYEQENLDSPNGLMNWAPQGSGPSCGGAATDADEDMAFALAMADRQWGGQGGLSKSYKATAIDQITKIWDTEIFNYKYVRAGDGSWATNANLNPSYFAPAYYRVFATLDPMNGPQPKDDWSGAIDQSYATIGDALNNGNASTGLVPGWCDDSNGGTCTPGPGGQPGNYQYDACRMPFRIALDWCWFGEPRAQSYVAKTSSFFMGVGARNIVDGYGLDGTPQAAHPGQLSAAFIGPAAVGAMSASSFVGFLNDAYAEVATDKLMAGGAYYEESWTVMSLLMMSGNFLNYASYSAP